MEKQIYERTNGGLDIIRRYFPDVKDKQKFKLRPDERTPSASLWRNNKGIYCITDFGNDAKAIDAIHLIMRQEGCTYCEAVNREADALGLTANKVTMAPKVNKVATTDADGITHVESSEFSEADLKFWGVPKEILIKYGWQVCQSYTSIKGGQKITVSITDGYRMYVRNCCGWYKIYKPQDSYARFMIEGEKPDNYIHGLTELQNAYKTHNDSQEDEKQLPAAVLCSGERDAMVAAAHGYHPIWKNSESEKLTYKMYAEVKKYVKRIYNIPDIDATGIKCGKELALQYTDIYTVRLPNWLATYNNNGKPRKDLRDWYDFCNKKSDFEKLIESGLPAKFWNYTEDDKGNSKVIITDIYFFYFLSLLNFYKVVDSDKVEHYVYIDKNIVRPITMTDVKANVQEWLINDGANIALRNVVFKYLRKNNALDDLEVKQLNTKYFGPDWQIFQFQNNQVKVTANDIKVNTNAPINYWEHQVIPYQYRQLAPSFTADEKDIQVLNINSHFFRYLINTSRIYWREELEERAGEDEQYRQANKWKIDGSLLTSDEVVEQKQNLMSKIFAIGYMLHRYKFQDKAFAPWVMENKVIQSTQANGGSGKSFMFKSLSYLLNTVEFNGRNDDDQKDRFNFDRINDTTALLLVQDASRDINFEYWYNLITDNFVVKTRYVNNKEIRFEDSPKVAFTSNFAPPIKYDDTSSFRRILFVVMSDYYHTKTEDNGYKESRVISDDFGYTILTRGYKEEYFNEDFNFMMECLKYYLYIIGKGIKKIEAKTNNVMERIRLQNIGDNFNIWADVFFSDIEVYNRFLSRKAVRADYIDYVGVKNITPNSFYKKMLAYCKNNDIICNPDEFFKDDKGNDKRIRKNFNDAPNYGKMDDCFYFRKMNQEPIEYKEITLPF